MSSVASQDWGLRDFSTLPAWRYRAEVDGISSAWRLRKKRANTYLEALEPALNGFFLGSRTGLSRGRWVGMAHPVVRSVCGGLAVYQAQRLSSHVLQQTVPKMSKQRLKDVCFQLPQRRHQNLKITSYFFAYCATLELMHLEEHPGWDRLINLHTTSLCLPSRVTWNLHADTQTLIHILRYSGASFPVQDI